MPLPQRSWLYHTPPSWARDEIYFITLCCQLRGQNQLCTEKTAGNLLDSVRHYHEQGRWYSALWLLMPDHLHALVAVPPTETLGKAMSGWKRYTSTKLGIEWQHGFFDHRLRHDESYNEKATYIRMNPVRKGLVAKPEDWPHIWSPPVE